MDDSRLFDFSLSDAQEARAAMLHRNSIIIDMASRYGGSAIFDEYPEHLIRELAVRAEEAASKADMLAEAIYWPFELALNGKSELIRDRLIQSGLTCGTYEANLHIPDDESDPLAWPWEEKIARYAELPWLRFVKSASEIRQAKADGAVAFFANCQPITPLSRDIRRIDDAYSRGLRSLMLTYNRMDNVGVGCTERVDAGLSIFGLEIVDRCNDIGIIVDVSHCGQRTTFDACRRSKKPVTANHTGARAVYEHARAKTDPELRAIADTGGLVGIYAAPAFVSGDDHVSITHMLDHIDYIVDLIGWKHVGIGTDWPWPIPRDVLEKTVGIEPSKKFGFRPEDRVNRLQRMEGLEDCRDLINLTRGLVCRGYDDGEIRGILGENFLRVFEEVC